MHAYKRISQHAKDTNYVLKSKHEKDTKLTLIPWEAAQDFITSGSTETIATSEEFKLSPDNRNKVPMIYTECQF